MKNRLMTFLCCSMMPYLILRAQTISPNIQVHPNPSTHQFETSITVHPTNPNIVLAAANAGKSDGTASSIGWYYTTDGGVTWRGRDTLQMHTNFITKIGDPSVGVDLDGNLFVNGTSGVIPTFNIIVARTTNNGTDWTQTSVPPENSHKNHIAIDVNPGSLHKNNIYVAYAVPGGGTPIRFSRSTDRGQSFSTPVTINGGIGSPGVNGPNLAIGPGGELYATWVGTGNPGTLGFNVSTDGGVSWGTAKSIRMIKNVNPVKGVDYGRSLPSMAVDRSNDTTRGSIYIVYADNSVSPDIFLIRSTDGGTTWSDSVKVNQDDSERDQWLPWISVDSETGALFVVYYDSRNFPNNDSAQVYISGSRDGGKTFSDKLVSSVPFKPAAVPVFPNYGGAYIGVSALRETVWTCWYDNRTGIFQAYVSRLMGSEIVTGIAVQRLSSQMPRSYILGQNFPNPFNPSTKIQFSVVSRQFTVLKIFDLLGREAATLVNEELRPGSYEVTWDATGLPSGTYFYTLTAGAFTETKKLLFLK